ncbi:MAG: DnaB-like helicase C-terminal domain-containing protein [Clostridia bacterium]
MSELVRIKGLGEKYNDDIITSLYNTKQLLSNYDSSWLEENVGPWIQVRNLDMVIRKAIAYMKTTKVTAENAAEVVETVRHMLITETVIDFSFHLGKDFFDPASHLQTRLARTSTGYDYIDLCLKGGYWKGSLIVFLSGPKFGKSLWMCNLAARSVQMGYNCAYITFELQEEIVNMRIGSNLLNISNDIYEEKVKDQDFMKRKMTEFKQSSVIPLGKLHVKEFPSSTCSTNDLRTYLKKAEEILGYKFDNIFVDYINIMKNWRNPNTENTYMKIKQNSEDLVLTNTSESSALLHTVDVYFAIITSPEMKARSEYFLKNLANRVTGYENTRKRYTVDWKYFRIEEDKNSQIQDMDFFINRAVAGHQHPRGTNLQTNIRGTQTDIAMIIGSNQNPEFPETSIDISGTGLF